MALSRCLGFALRVIGDGSDRMVSATIASSPFGLKIPAAGDATYAFPPGFSVAIPAPTGVVNVQSGNNHVVTAVLSNGTLDFTYGVGDMPVAGEVDTLFGDLTY